MLIINILRQTFTPHFLWNSCGSVLYFGAACRRRVFSKSDIKNSVESTCLKTRFPRLSL